MPVTQITTIDGQDIEWTGSPCDAILRALSDDAAKDIVAVFGPAAKTGEEIGFAIEFPWDGDRQETRRAVGTVTLLDESSEFVTVHVRLTEPLKIDVKKLKR